MPLPDDLVVRSLPGFFHCDRTHCDLSIAVCLKRQRKNDNAIRKWWKDIPFLSCWKCPQGKANRTAAVVHGPIKIPTTDRSA